MAQEVFVVGARIATRDISERTWPLRSNVTRLGDFAEGRLKVSDGMKVSVRADNITVSIEFEGGCENWPNIDTLMEVVKQAVHGSGYGEVSVRRYWEGQDSPGVFD
jgi:hypothetical protein